VSVTQANARLGTVRESYVAGGFVAGTEELLVENPATETTIATVPGVDITVVEAAILAARRAFDDGPWPRMPVAERIAAVTRLIDHLDAKRDDLISTLIAEAGCPAGLASLLQVRIPIAHARTVPAIYSTLPEFEYNPVPLEELTVGGRVAASAMVWEPVGVVSAISAYNFPLFTSLAKLVPALVTGCTVILRPSPLTPLAVLEIGAAAEAAGLPPGVLNVVVEPGLEGARLMSTHPAVDLVSFTGSTAVGSQIFSQAASTIKMLHLELGGKSVQLYLPEALDRVTAGVTAVFRAHAGQGCVLQTRVLVPNERKAEILERLVDPCSALRVGDPADPAVEVGPVISARQVARCEAAVGAALAGGGSVVAGGSRPPGLERGYFFEPTVLDVPDNSNAAAQEEIFGPVVVVLGYADLDEAVAIANDTPLGLAGGVFGPPDRALAVARRLRTGTVNVNSGVFSAWASSGGWKRSGLGRERGREGIRAFQQHKHIGIGL
jgi:aldehyde dehydrogenase (NAD+)